MKQIIQNLKSGETSLIDVPSPELPNNNLLIHTNKSLISAGTEKMLVDFAKSGYLSKARQQPEKVKEVLQKVKTDGLATTLEAVQSKLSQPITLGYCNVGRVVQVGNNVEGFSVGDRVVSNGSHAEVVSVSKNLCARIPDNVSDDDASFTVLAAIGLQGIRLANPTIGENFVVIGLGPIGLLTVQMLLAQGCRVLAIDVQDDRLALAKNFGAEIFNSAKNKDTLSFANKFSRGQGVDSVLITASSKSDEIISLAAKMSRKRGRIILIGVTGLNLLRDDFYEKELSFQVSCSYGPGRYDSNYENNGNDYPIAFVRWTEQRNFQAVLDLMNSKNIDVSSLISHKIPFEEAPEFYKKISKGEQGLGMILEYTSPYEERVSKTIQISDLPIKKHNDKQVVAGFIGAGNYASRVLIPAFKQNNVQLHTVVTSNGLSGSIHGMKSKFKFSSTDVSEVLNNNEINTVVIGTRHDSHCDLVCKAIEGNKHIYVEKPLALNHEELEKIKNVYESKNSKVDGYSQRHLMVGFNRRFSPHILKMKSLLSSSNEPKSFVMTMNAGNIPSNHWVHDSDIGGGRIIGEACHYIDLMLFLAGSKIIDISARCMGQKFSGKINDDNATITLGFSDGSFGTINYLSNGSSSFPKETINVFTSGKVLALDNFRTLKGYGWGSFNTMKTWRQDKGQKYCVKAFIESINSGKQSIPIEDIFEVASVSLDIAEILRKQS